MNAVVAQDGSSLILPRAEVIELGAVDQIFYCRHFFPKTFRQESPDYHRDFWRWFDDPLYDLFAAEIFRGGAKTTLTRGASRAASLMESAETSSR